MASRLNFSDVPPWMYWTGTVTFFLIIASIIWFALPGAAADHRFVSPSGRIALTVTEKCGEGGCTRAIVAEESEDGRTSRFSCVVPLTEERPVLLNAYPLWTADEAAVDLVYADADGVGGRFGLDLRRDCTAS